MGFIGATRLGDGPPCAMLGVLPATEVQRRCDRKELRFARRDTSVIPRCQNLLPKPSLSSPSTLKPCAKRSTLRARGSSFPSAGEITKPNLSRAGSSNLPGPASGTRTGSRRASWLSSGSGMMDRCCGIRWRRLQRRQHVRDFGQSHHSGDRRRDRWQRHRGYPQEYEPWTTWQHDCWRAWRRRRRFDP